MCFRPTRLERLIAVEATAGVHQKLWCPSQQETKVFRATLKNIVEDAQICS
jgi:hypothetical protein